ncbi:hypothetical protein CLOP_g23779 [Closterium sp. NIES-67]|nr:hypothetical protein CLOP_g23779 [Closterium sp. NIES-67]
MAARSKNQWQLNQRVVLTASGTSGTRTLPWNLDRSCSFWQLPFISAEFSRPFLLERPCLLLFLLLLPLLLLLLFLGVYLDFVTPLSALLSVSLPQPPLQSHLSHSPLSQSQQQLQPSIIGEALAAPSAAAVSLRRKWQLGADSSVRPPRPLNGETQAAGVVSPPLPPIPGPQPPTRPKSAIPGPLLPSRPNPLIPGSRLFSPSALRAFERRFECLASQGVWDLDPLPRPLPWTPRGGWSGGECDVRWAGEEMWREERAGEEDGEGEASGDEIQGEEGGGEETRGEESVGASREGEAAEGEESGKDGGVGGEDQVVAGKMGDGAVEGRKAQELAATSRLDQEILDQPIAETDGSDGAAFASDSQADASAISEPGESEAPEAWGAPEEFGDLSVDEAATGSVGEELSEGQGVLVPPDLDESSLAAPEATEETEAPEEAAAPEEVKAPEVINTPETPESPEAMAASESPDAVAASAAPEGNNLPDEQTTPEGNNLPDEQTTPEGNNLPDEQTTPEGNNLPDEQTTPDGNSAPSARQEASFPNLAFEAADRISIFARPAAEWRVRETLRYRWRVKLKCGAWGEFDRARLATVLAGRTVLIVGDSLSSMMFRSIRNHLLQRHVRDQGFSRYGEEFVERGREERGKRESVERRRVGRVVARDEVLAVCEQRLQHPQLQERPDVAFCGAVSLGFDHDGTGGDSSSSSSSSSSGSGSSGSSSSSSSRSSSSSSSGSANNSRLSNTLFLYLRDDILHTSLEPTIRIPELVSLPWIDIIQPQNGDDPHSHTLLGGYQPASILILNRGAHYKEDEVFRAELNETLNKARAAVPDLLIIYRSSPPGHKDCDILTDPLADRQNPGDLPYHWGDFARQNEIARELVRGVGGVFLDVDYMTALRPDGHSSPPADCLHYCLPGPPDEWTRLLYHMLLDLL